MDEEMKKRLREWYEAVSALEAARRSLAEAERSEERARQFLIASAMTEFKEGN